MLIEHEAWTRFGESLRRLKDVCIERWDGVSYRYAQAGMGEKVVQQNEWAEG